MKVGVIGYGYWGPNLVRNLMGVEGCTVLMVSDLRPERLTTVQKHYPSITTTRSADDVFNNNEIDAVAIATPVMAHYPLIKKALLTGKHVLAEKPMTTSKAQASELIQIAVKNERTLMVDHTFLYTGAVRKIKKIIESGEIGDLQYYDSLRINLGLFQKDINVLWDLAVHDISILLHLINKKPKSVQAIGVTHTCNDIENIAYLTLHYDNGFIAHCNCSWVSPVKVRTTYIGGTKKMIVYNDLEGSEKVKVYDSGYEINTDEDLRKVLVGYRTGDVFSPKIDTKEALAEMASDFVKACTENKEPLSNWKLAYEVVNILEAAEISIKSNGSRITLRRDFGDES
jgi:predicted dehydrogenase